MKQTEAVTRKIEAKQKRRKASTLKETGLVALDPNGSDSTILNITSTPNPASADVDAQASIADLPTGSVFEGNNAMLVPEAPVGTPVQTHIIDVVDSDSEYEANTLMS